MAHLPVQIQSPWVLAMDSQSWVIFPVLAPFQHFHSLYHDSTTESPAEGIKLSNIQRMRLLFVWCVVVLRIAPGLCSLITTMSANPQKDCKKYKSKYSSKLHCKSFPTFTDREGAFYFSLHIYHLMNCIGRLLEYIRTRWSPANWPETVPRSQPSAWARRWLFHRGSRLNN